MRLYYIIKNKISDAYWDFRARCQRFKRGYSYGDVWNMSFWFMRTIRPMLIHLCNNHQGVPLEFENNPDGWRDVLTEMVTCLDLMDEDNVYNLLGFYKLDDYKRMTKEDYENIYRIMEENKDSFFELFSKYFFDLWD